jgi:hypothetical protein
LRSGGRSSRQRESRASDQAVVLRSQSRCLLGQNPNPPFRPLCLHVCFRQLRTFRRMRLCARSAKCMARPRGTRRTSKIDERESCINVSGL